MVLQRWVILVIALLGMRNSQYGMVQHVRSYDARTWHDSSKLHINEEVDMHDSAKLEFHRQVDFKRFFCSGLSNLSQPKSTRLVIEPVPKDNEEPEEKNEEDMSDRIGREKAEEEQSAAEGAPHTSSCFTGANKNTLIRVDDDKKRAPIRENKGVKPVADRKAVYVLVIKDFEEYELKEMRATKFWSQIEVTFKEMDTARTELKCFQAFTKSRAAS
ncbi:unnamed protein product [Camellia sinensis]